MTKDQKIQIIEEYIGFFDKPGVYLMDFKGLNVAEITELRKKLRSANVSMRVVKNTLANRALQQMGIEMLNGYVIGPTGVVWSPEDSTVPARVLLEFIKKYKKGTIKVGLIDGVLFKENEIEAISKLPTKNELYAIVASTLNAPIVKLARSLNAVPVKFVRTVDALREKKSEEES